ncbi:MAG: TIGR01244 family sulfur transferase [Rhodobacteraceae bacterium]|nr:TIGR01244 family sulfur transferase [Paracoccaceae bacterium]
MLFNLFAKKNVQQVGALRATELAPRYSVSGQITVADIADIKAAGYDTIMCNRPDGEAPGQPAASQIKRAAKKAGLNFYHVPMGGAMAPNTVGDFKAVVNTDSNGKVFAYCRTGNRCTMLWKMAKA